MKKKQKEEQIDQEFKCLIEDKQEIKELLKERIDEKIGFMDIFNLKVNEQGIN